MSTQPPNDGTTLHLTTDADPSWNPLPFDIPYDPTSPRQWDAIKRLDIPAKSGVYVVTPIPAWQDCPHSCIYVGSTEAKEGLKQRVWYLLKWRKAHAYSKRILNYVKCYAQLSDEHAEEEAKKLLQVSWSECPDHPVMLEYLLILRYQPHFKDKNLFRRG